MCLRLMEYFVEFDAIDDCFIFDRESHDAFNLSGRDDRIARRAPCRHSWCKQFAEYFVAISERLHLTLSKH